MPALTTAVASYTHPGRRRANQDAVVVRRLASGDELVAVADGMGGHSAGEVASAMALETLIAELESGAPLAAAVATANQTVFTRAQERTELNGMGTTLVVLLRSGTTYRVANVGDSRAYALDADAIRQITDDHSFVAEALRSGAISEADAETSPWRNALTRALGTDEAVDVDVFGPFRTEASHVVILCSDGLYKSVPAELIREYVLSTGELGTAVEALAALAYRRGSDDNITIAAVEFGAVERRPPSVTLPLPIRVQTTSAPAPQPLPQDGSPSTGPAAAAPQRPGARRARRGWVLPLLIGLLALLALLGFLLA